jgi:hypothetical protein
MSDEVEDENEGGVTLVVHKLARVENLSDDGSLEDFDELEEEEEAELQEEEEEEQDDEENKEEESGQKESNHGNYNPVDLHPVALKRRKRGILMKTVLFVPNLFGYYREKSLEQEMYELYEDINGVLKRSFAKLLMQEKVKPKRFIKERDQWIRMWMEIDEDHNNEMSIHEFTSYFSMEKCEWSTRVFLMINKSGTGVASLAEFLRFCEHYLRIDQKRTHEFAFRLLSRRNSTQYWPNVSTLNLEDVRQYLQACYRSKSTSQRNRRGMRVFRVMDEDGDGGLDSEEWHSFCCTNDTMVTMANEILMHLRKCIFGMPFWVERTRKLLRIESTAIFKKGQTAINKKSEKWHGKIGEAVIKKNKAPVKYVYDGPEAFVASIMKPSLRWAQPLTIRKKLKSSKEYEADFPEAVELARQAKAARREKVDALTNKATSLRGRQYDLLLEACGDLLHGRRKLRQAWKRWMESTNMADFGEDAQAARKAQIAQREADKANYSSADAQAELFVKINEMTERRKREAGDQAFDDLVRVMSQERIGRQISTGQRTEEIRLLYRAEGEQRQQLHSLQQEQLQQKIRHRQDYGLGVGAVNMWDEAEAKAERGTTTGTETGSAPESNSSAITATAATAATATARQRARGLRIDTRLYRPEEDDPDWKDPFPADYFEKLERKRRVVEGQTAQAAARAAAEAKSKEKPVKKKGWFS